MTQLVVERTRDDPYVITRAKALGGMVVADRAFHWVSLAAAGVVLLVLGGIIVFLVNGAWPAITTYGFDFFKTQRWASELDTPIFGSLAPLYGTIVSSLIAMVIAVPVGFGIAVFLTELCPEHLRRPIGVAIELLAGIPSIIYGMWGFFVLGPFLANVVEPPIISALSYVPGLNLVFAGPTSNQSLFNASLILAIMILPFITAISRDVFTTVPPVLKEAAYGVGCTRWEVVTNVVIPYTRVGLIGGVMLALGRALGETMAVTFIIGSVFEINASIFQPGSTISATIANQFAEAHDMQLSALFYLGLLLFVLTFVVLAGARILLARMRNRAGV